MKQMMVSGHCICGSSNVQQPQGENYDRNRAMSLPKIPQLAVCNTYVWTLFLMTHVLIT